MFYSHQRLARKAPLGQIWMSATMYAKINRKKLNKLNIIKICGEILNPAIPMALRLSGILMGAYGGVVIVYERKVKMLYDEVSRLLVEIKEAWKVKSAPEADPLMLPKRKSQAKREAITLPDKERMTLEEIEQSLQSNATTTGFQHNTYFSMRLDIMEELDIGNAGREGEDLGNNHHQAAPEDITIPDSYQANTDNPNRFDRFDNEGDDETQMNVTSGDYGQIPSRLIPSPPPPDDPKRELHVETGPTQTQGKADNPTDKLTESIHAYESFMNLHSDLNIPCLNISAVTLLCIVLSTRDVLRVKQMEPCGAIIISRGSKM